MKKSGGKLILKKLASDEFTITQIKNQIRKIISEGTKIDIVLLDYIDCVVPERSFDDEWKGEGSVMRKFEAMCHELDLVGWTATQGNRSSISSEVVTTDQMGGSIKKAQVGHVIISIAKTLQQKEMGLATIAITKSRVGKDGVIFENCTFNNATLEIDTQSSQTFLGFEEEKTNRNQKRVLDALEKRNKMLNQ
jgi:replicative DNA helicase